MWLNILEWIAENTHNTVACDVDTGGEIHYLTIL